MLEKGQVLRLKHKSVTSVDENQLMKLVKSASRSSWEEMRDQNAAVVGLAHMSQEEIKKVVSKKSPGLSPGKVKLNNNDSLANLR